jgi:hypothetical protein
MIEEGEERGTNAIQATTSALLKLLRRRLTLRRFGRSDLEVVLTTAVLFTHPLAADLIPVLRGLAAVTSLIDEV